MLSVVFQHCIMAEDIGLRVFKDEYISRNDHITGSSDLVRICRMSPGDQ